MASEQVPDAWIGQRVTLRYWSGDNSGTDKCRLDAVNDRGVVVLDDEDD